MVSGKGGEASPAASTTPKSGRGLHPDECDRLMGAPSIGSISGEERDGEQTVTDNQATGSR